MKSFPNTTRWKFKKFHRPNNSFNSLFECKIFLPVECLYGIQALEPGKLTAKQIESCRRALRRTLGKSAKIVLRPFPSVPVTGKSIASRMGRVKVLFLFGLLLYVVVLFYLKFLVINLCGLIIFS
jgi:ribosomal protein L16/L10AE